MNSEKKKILGISGSIRSHSANETLLNFIAQQYSASLTMTNYKYLAALPHFNPDMGDGDIPFVVEGFLQQIREADGVLICTPEYVFSLPGVLKNALEWTVASSVFSGKPVALIVASGLGEKAFESLQLIMHTIEATFDENTVMLIQGVRNKLDGQGKVSDQTLLKAIQDMMQAFQRCMDEKSTLR
jgi:chromate reductase